MNHETDETVDFVLGRGEVIKGMETGLRGMCAGERRKITVPPHLAYGDKREELLEGSIPPGSTLVFEVELIEVLDPMDDLPKNLFWWVGETPTNSFGDSDVNRDKKISKEEIILPAARADYITMDTAGELTYSSLHSLDLFHSSPFFQFANYCHMMADSDKGVFLPGRREQDLIDDMFSFQDRNRDGFISFHEFAGPKIHEKHDEL
ncbi:FKBP9 [Branchiostoma lanceolatum]|uniref:peptidylprolyl isomerase n=1 Tax=Branchiostoma lanceolatum TaxID=7740 RepID=A0A8K0A969_BRALA|nr:FKBP9 [Branchiostoma lanceolatum]